ncbi:MAG: ATP-binding cassette domain-containing protein, partial [Actinomycetes bacterium]
LRDPSLVFRFLKWTSLLSALCAALFALAPSIPVAVVVNIALTMLLAVVLPGVLSIMSMAIPSRARAVGFAVGSWWAIPGLALLPFIGWIADNWGTRLGMLMMAPVLAVGGLVVASAGKVVNRDLQDVWSSSAARSRALLDRQEGRSKLLVVTDLNVGYGGLQVLFDVSLEVAEGEVVALMGTNGAGKSTLLRAVTGLTEADYGSVILDGRDITHCPPNEIAALGVGQVPGGQGTFGSLTVAENLDVAGWLLRKEPAELRRRTGAVLEVFPELADRLDDPAADLSGGQQQMLALAMALVTRPRLLVVDELSLGLAPVVVGRLAELVAEVAEGGTTVLLVEQSINVALSLASTAVFMERGRVRFSGPADELARRPDLLRAVFLDGGAAAAAGPAPHQVDRGGGPGLELEGVVRRFGGNVAVDAVDLVVQPGEIVGLVGQNGAGKTTLIDLVSGLQPLDAGTVRLGGADLSGQRPSARARAGLGRTFQGGRLFPGLVVAEAVAVALERSTDVRDPFNAALRLPAAVDSEDAVAARVDDLLVLFGLEAYRDTFTAELSTGTRRIVELACAVAHQPSVLLLDEPAAGVAQREVEQLGALLLRIRDELGCAMVVVEHDVPLLARVADRLVALEAGRVIAAGPPAEVLDSPEVVRSYLGDVAVAAQRSGPVGGSIGADAQGDEP